jgi:hypothetical protein
LIKIKLIFQQALAYTAMGIMVRLAACQPPASQQCEDANGVIVGDSGQIVAKNSIDGVFFQRKGGTNCSCSNVSHLARYGLDQNTSRSFSSLASSHFFTNSISISCNQAEAKCMIEDSTFGSMDCNSLRMGLKPPLKVSQTFNNNTRGMYNN